MQHEAFPCRTLKAVKCSCFHFTPLTFCCLHNALTGCVVGQVRCCGGITDFSFPPRSPPLLLPLFVSWMKAFLSVCCWAWRPNQAGHRFSIRSPRWLYCKLISATVTTSLQRLHKQLESQKSAARKKVHMQVTALHWENDCGESCEKYIIKKIPTL